MTVKSVIDLLKKNKTILKTDRSHLKDEKERILNTPLANLNHSAINRSVDIALNDVRHLKIVHNLCPIHSSNLTKNEQLILNKYHIYSKKRIIKVLNKNSQNKYLTFYSIANSSSILKYPSNNSDTISALIKNQVNDIKFQKYEYYLVDALDNVNPHISVSYVIYILTDLINNLSRQLRWSNTNVGKAKIIAMALKHSVISNHSQTYNHQVINNLKALPKNTQLGQTFNLVARNNHIWSSKAILVGLQHLSFISSDDKETKRNCSRNIPVVKDLIKHHYTYLTNSSKQATFIPVNLQCVLSKMIKYLDRLLTLA